MIVWEDSCYVLICDNIKHLNIFESSTVVSVTASACQDIQDIGAVSEGISDVAWFLLPLPG